MLHQAFDSKTGFLITDLRPMLIYTFEQDMVQTRSWLGLQSQRNGNELLVPCPAQSVRVCP